MSPRCSIDTAARYFDKPASESVVQAVEDAVAVAGATLEATKEGARIMRWKIDECPDANGYWTLREDDGTEHGDTETCIATIYGGEIEQGLIESAPRLAEQVRIMREALDEIQRMSGVRGRWLDDNGCAVETDDNDGTDPENKPDGDVEWSAYDLDEQNAALECITERALQALEATKEGA